MQLQIGRPCGNTATVGNIPDAYNFTTEKEIDSKVISVKHFSLRRM